jgi:hypothetical protein
MANRRMHLSGEGKEILDQLVDALEVDRPNAVKIALAKGLSMSDGALSSDYTGSKNKWTIPDNIIKDKEFILFKHLIINEVNKPLNEEEIHQYMLAFIEHGLRKIEQQLKEKSSLGDNRLLIL